MKTLIEDSRPITYLATIGNSQEDGYAWRVGEIPKIDEIRAYEENGSLSPVPWFAIIVTGEIIARVNGHNVEIIRYN